MPYCAQWDYIPLGTLFDNYTVQNGTIYILGWNSKH